MSKSVSHLTHKAPWLFVMVLAVFVGWRAYSAWRREQATRQLWDVVQGCTTDMPREMPNTIRIVTVPCDPVKVHDLLTQGANVHYTRESSPSIFEQTSSFHGTVFNEQGRQFLAQAKPVRDHVANLLLDAWVADQGKVKLEARQETNENEHACQLALELNRPEVILRLLETGLQVDKNRLLGAAVSAAQLGLVQALVQRGASLNYVPSQGCSLLYWACIGVDKPGKLEVVKYLVEHGADVNHLADDHSSALQSAAYGPSEIVEYLLAQGAKVNVQNTEGNTALLGAASSGRLENVKMLLAHGADPALKSKQGKTALSQAIQYKHSEVVRLLQQAGAKE